MKYPIQDHFSNHFNKGAEVVIQSPGRINTIGEHTDYNDGFVLPAAINYYMMVAVSKNNTNSVNLYSIDYNKEFKIELSELGRVEQSWVNLILGVLDQLKDKIGGIDLAFGGNIPEGAGLSSSAALCCGVSMAISELFELNLSKWDVAKTAQKSEHEYALVQCGIMDQFACVFGLNNSILLLNCDTLEYEVSTADISGYRLLVINSNVKHSLGDSDYNKRKEESASALGKIKVAYKEVKSYQDVTEVMLEKMRSKLPEAEWKRAFHVVTENNRVFEMKDALKAKDFGRVGTLLTKGHNSLKDAYEVTCEETDFLVEELNKQNIVYGARQVGGGFGGCILALVEDKAIDSMLDTIDTSYKKNFGLNINNIPIEISKGCHRITTIPN